MNCFSRHRQKVAAALEALPDHKTADSKRFARNYFNTEDYGLVKSKTRATLITDKNEEISIIWTDHLRKLFVIQLSVRIVIELTFFYFYYLIQTQQHPPTAKVKKSEIRKIN